MDTFFSMSIGALLLFLVVVGAGGYLGINYAYRWNLACAQSGGQKMENSAGTVVCVKGPVQLINIAVRPW